ncbi:MAG TPA: hypothetical protein VKA46_20720 [Gemmataceae bacterium]|nr:hypothetical protein [Gemmataceae bacterium]
MADEAATPKDPDTSPHNLFLKLVDDNGNPKPLIVLRGYFGKGKGDPDGSVRLYLGLDFRRYYRIKVTDVLHTERSDPDDPNSPTKAFVAAAAKVDFVQIGTTLSSLPIGVASYLQGAITGGYLAAAKAAARGPSPRAEVPGFTNPPPCPVTLPHHTCLKPENVEATGFSNPPPCQVSPGHPHCLQDDVGEEFGFSNPPPCALTIPHHTCFQSLLIICL